MAVGKERFLWHCVAVREEFENAGSGRDHPLWI